MAATAQGHTPGRVGWQATASFLILLNLARVWGAAMCANATREFDGLTYPQTTPLSLRLSCNYKLRQFITIKWWRYFVTTFWVNIFNCFLGRC